MTSTTTSRLALANCCRRALWTTKDLTVASQLVSFLQTPICIGSFSSSILSSPTTLVPSTVVRNCTSQLRPRAHSTAPPIAAKHRVNPGEGETVTLQDGRTLGYHLFGDPNGIPVFYIHGVVDTGLTLQGKEDAMANEMGIRWIAPDRPGIGKSTLQPGRKLIDYVDDIRQLASHLDLKEYYLLGVSGGSAYALACAMILPRERTRGVGIGVGVAPWSAGRRGQTLKIRYQMHMMKYWPSRLLKQIRDEFVPLAQDPDPKAMADRLREDMLPYVDDPAQADAYMDTDPMQSSMRVYRQYYCQGIKGHIDDMRVLTRPWGFRIEDVGYEGVRLWYAGADVNTPPDMGLYLARRLPKSIYKEYSGETHASLLLGDHFREMLSELITK